MHIELEEMEVLDLKVGVGDLRREEIRTCDRYRIERI
jgi:hypothetical protein